MTYLRNHPEIAAGSMKWRVDEGFVQAAKDEGCDPLLCHYCEKPMNVGDLMSISKTEKPTGDSKNPVIAGFVHAKCSGNTVPTKEDWGKKHGREEE